MQAGAGLLRLAEGQSDGKSDARSETFAARLEALTHALGSQHTLTTRPVNALVPGQPLALQQSGISEALVDRVMWMSSQNLKSADIQMEPADLGRLEVRIHMTAEQTQVTFASANAGVRDALESQMHRLRDMFNQQGMTSPNVNVSDQSLSRGWQGQQGESGRGQGRGGRGNGGEDEPVLSGVAEIRSQPGRQGRGLVDYFA
ncbi:flagellar hook-length control protein [compost metagenome]